MRPRCTTSKRAETHKLPPVLLDVIQVDRVTGESIPVTCSVDAPPTELLRLLVREVVVVALVEHSVCVRRVSTGISGRRGGAHETYRQKWNRNRRRRGRP